MSKAATLWDWIFSFFHLFLVLGALLYAFYSLAIGNVIRFCIMLVLLVAYYFLVLHKPMLMEIKRRKKMKSKGDKR